jgi:inositol transport system substrate-binding protein
MTATSLQSAQELANLNMKAMSDLLTCKETEVTKDVGNPLITKENVGEYIDLYREAGLVDQ